MHHRAFETQARHRALELIGRRLRIRRGQHRERGEAAVRFVDDLLQPVVRRARDRGRGLGIEALRRRRGVRQHLQVDAGFVHLADAQRADIVEPLAQRRIARFGPGLLEMARHLGIEVVLFECDDLRFGFGHGARF